MPQPVMGDWPVCFLMISIVRKASASERNAAFGKRPEQGKRTVLPFRQGI